MIQNFAKMFYENKFWWGYFYKIEFFWKDYKMLLTFFRIDPWLTFKLFFKKIITLFQFITQQPSIVLHLPEDMQRSTVNKD